MLKFTFMLFKAWLDSSSCRYWGVSSWETARLFGNDVWTMGCTRLPNLSTYSLAVIRPWRAIMGPTETVPRYCCPNHHRTSLAFHFWNQAFRVVGFLSVLQTWTLPDVGSSMKDDSSDHITLPFPVVWCPGFMVVTPPCMHLGITFSNQRLSNCSPSVDVDLWSSCVTIFAERGSCRWMFSSAVTRDRALLSFFETVLLHVRRSLAVNVDLRPLSLFADVVFPWHVYANITLETVALDTPINVAFSSQMLQLNAHQQTVFFQNITSLKFSDFSHELSFNTITNALTKALQSVNYFQYLSCQFFYVVRKRNVLKL
jgi:hypothetical protein